MHHFAETESWQIGPDLERVLGVPLPDSILYEWAAIAWLAEYL